MVIFSPIILIDVLRITFRTFSDIISICEVTMGTLRGKEDRNYLKGITEEVTDLFGADAILYKFSAVTNSENRDPIYDEPSCGTATAYTGYPLKAFFFQYNDTPFVTGEGTYFETTAQGHICFLHLENAGVPVDSLGERVSEGDVICYHPADYGNIYYDIIQTTKDGWVNDSGYYAGYTFSLKRSTKFVPERKELS